MSPRFVLISLKSLSLDLIVLLIKTHDLLGYRRCSTVCRLVIEVENSFTGWTSSIIHYWFGQNSH